MKSKKIAALTGYYFVILTLSLISCLNLGDSTSICLDDCSTVTKACLDAANGEMAKCKDSVCEHAALYQAEQCLTEAMTCVSKCIKVVEKKLR